MANLFFYTRGFTTGRDVPVLDSISDILSLYEKDSLDHWIFGNDASTLTGRNNARLLKRQTSAVIPLTWAAKAVGLPQKAGESLEVPLTDTLGQTFTFAGVYNVQSNAGIILLVGTLGSSGVTPVGGFGLFTSGSNLYVTVRESANVANSKLIGAIDPAKPFYASISYNKTTKVINIVAIQGTTTYETTVTSGTYNPTDLPVYLGQGRYVGTSGGASLINEFVAWDTPKTVSDLKDVAGRMLNRGVIF